MWFPRLQAIVDTDVATLAGWEPGALAARYLEGGARWLQIRAKGMHTGPLLDLCDRVVALARPARGFVIVNDRADVAWLAGAAGVHVGQEDLAPSVARSLLGPEAIVGWSTHSRDQLAAAPEPATYVAVGPVFGTRTKDTGYEAVGLDLLRTAAVASRPVVAIGGITLDRVPDVLGAGASAVAVVTDLLAGGDPATRVRQYVETLEHRPR